MNVANFCIKHKVTTLLAVIMIVIFGAVFTTQLQMALLPDMEAPMAVVMCYYNGATPADMEELVTRPLESAIMSVPGVETVSSTSADGASTIQITYQDDTDLDIAATKLREKFDALLRTSLLLKDTDKLAADDLALFLGGRDAGKKV